MADLNSKALDDAIFASELGSGARLVAKLRGVQARKLKVLEELGIPREQWSDESISSDIAVLQERWYALHVAEELRWMSKFLRVADDSHLQGLLSAGPVVFEGAQGVLLDEWWGFAPYTTRSTTTFDNALAILETIGYAGEGTKLGVLRSYSTRHGPGPFVTDNRLTAGGGWPEPHNSDHNRQGAFRVGRLDLVTSRYAVEVSKPDALVMTHLDRVMGWACDHYQHQDNLVTRLPLPPAVDGDWNALDSQRAMTRMLERSRPRYRHLAPDDDRPLAFAEAVANELGLPLAMISSGPTARDKEVMVEAWAGR